jgi:tRNA(fMet)-specific endonuclease VapC
MRYLLDTNAVSDIAREKPMTQARLNALGSGDEVIVCPIVRGEALFGVARMPEGKNRRDMEAKNAKVLASFACRAIPAEAAEHYVRIKLDCQRRGVSLDENDLWIAATALALGATLVTRDTDFHRVEALAVQDWTR